MFRTISIIGFVVTIVGIALHCGFSMRPKLDDLFGAERKWRVLNGLRVLVYLLMLALPEQKLKLIGVLRKVIYLLALVCFVVLTINGFYASLILGERLCGYRLMLQVTAGGIFTGCVAVLAVMWAHNCQFDKGDLERLPHFIRRKAMPADIGPSDTNDCACKKYALGRKICFWLIILLAVPVILSIVLSMFSLFGTDGQHFLLNMHRYSVLALATVGIIHIYLIIRSQMGK